MKYLPFTKTHYSLLQAMSKPAQIVKRLNTLGLDSAVLCDDNLSGSVSFHTAMTNAGKKPIIGQSMKFYGKPLLVIARNGNGWNKLVRFSSELSQSRLNGFLEPGEDIFDLLDPEDNLLVYTEHHPVYDRFKSTFCLFRDVAATPVYYPNPGDEKHHRILLCTALNKTLNEVASNLSSYPDIAMFFNRNNFYIKSYEEMVQQFSKENVDATLKIEELCEPFKIARNPQLPPFECPNGMSEIEYIKSLAREGWIKKITKDVKDNKEKTKQYVDRLQYELGVIQKANLAGYFLIVRDILRFVVENNWIKGPGRGSAAGCLTSYLVNITNIDPIPYNLLFSRFFNEGRIAEGKISYPDIDVDVPAGKREEIINYIRSKYGEARVAHIVSFQTMKGRGAVKDVVGANTNISFSELNAITENIPNEAEIADELQEMRETTGESSIIRWALENRPDKFKEWVYLDNEGKLDGPFATHFEQAMKLEGTKTFKSKHAAGVVIGPRNLKEDCPMIVAEKDNALISGLEFMDLETIGLIKIDILGVAILDKIMGVRNLCNTGTIQ